MRRLLRREVQEDFLEAHAERPQFQQSPPCLTMVDASSRRTSRPVSLLISNS